MSAQTLRRLTRGPSWAHRPWSHLLAIFDLREPSIRIKCRSLLDKASPDRFGSPGAHARTLISQTSPSARHANCALPLRSPIKRSMRNKLTSEMPGQSGHPLPDPHRPLSANKRNSQKFAASGSRNPAVVTGCAYPHYHFAGSAALGRSYAGTRNPLARCHPRG